MELGRLKKALEQGSKGEVYLGTERLNGRREEKKRDLFGRKIREKRIFWALR